MDDLEQLLGWPRCKDLSELRAYAQQWEDAVLEYENRSNEKFPISYWRVGLLKIAPQRIYDELRHIKANFPTYVSLKNHIRTLVVDLRDTPTKGLHSLEE